MEAPHGTRTILYLRLPGLIAQAARRLRPQAASAPFVVAEGRLVRDVCPLALGQGVRVGMSVVQARRLCPSLLSVPREELNAEVLSKQLWDALADLSPVVEPADADGGFADITGLTPEVVQRGLERRIVAEFGLMPVIGMGVSRLAALACAQCSLPPERLSDASVAWLWPEGGEAVLGRLQRLSLATFGAVAAVPEESLRLHFGKIAPLLHRRAHGVDLTPVRALYPPPFVETTARFDDAIINRERLDAVLAQMSAEVEERLRNLGGHGRCVALHVDTERGQERQEWVVPTPVRTAQDVSLAVRRLLGQMRLAAPITAVGISVLDVSPPTARTPDLFCPGPGADPVALESVRRRLAARFGLTTLTTPSQWPKSSRQKRQAALSEQRQGAFL